MHAAIAEHSAEIADLCRRFGVTRLEAFGSAARGADFDPAYSDADFLVAFERDTKLDPLVQFFGLAFALEDILGRKVDLVEIGALRNRFVIATVERDRELVYAA